jgi:hypothetical protein
LLYCSPFPRRRRLSRTGFMFTAEAMEAECVRVECMGVECMSEVSTEAALTVVLADKHSEAATMALVAMAEASIVARPACI